MHSRIALALACALGCVAAGAVWDTAARPGGSDAALAQSQSTPTRFVPRTLGPSTGPAIVQPTTVPTLSFPSFFSPTPTPNGGTVTPLPTPPPLPSTPTPLAALPTPILPLPTATRPPSDQALPPAPDPSVPEPVAVPTTSVTPSAAVQPPVIQLQFGSALYDGVRGSWCWTAEQTGPAPVPGICADLPPPAFESVLAWPAGQPLEWVIDGPAPTAFSLQVYSRPSDPIVLRTDLPPGTTVTWLPTIPPGAYVLGVAARWPQGDVTYFFPIGILEAETAAAAPALATGDGIVGGPPAAPAAPPTPTGPEAPPAVPPPPPVPSVPPVPPATTTRALPTSVLPRSAPTSVLPASAPTSALPAAPPTSVLPPSPPLATPTLRPAPTAPLPPAPTPAAPPDEPGAQPAAAPPVAAAPTAPNGGPSRVLLRDDFIDPASGWPRESGDPAARRLGYLDGEYVVARLAGSGGAAFVAHPEPFADFHLEIDARLLLPSENAYVFVDFRRQQTGDYYSFLVEPAVGRFLLLRHANGTDARLVDWTPSPDIRNGTATNRLGVRARGGDIRLLVNGAEVGQAQDSRLGGGWVGFGVGSLNDDPAEARFSRLVVLPVDEPLTTD